MKTFFSLFLCLIVRLSFAQVTIDPTVAKRYESTLNKVSATGKQNLIRFEKAPSQVFGVKPGFLIFTKYKIDTLNKLDTPKPDPSIQIYDVDTNKVTGKITYQEFKTTDEQEITYTPFPITVILAKDTLSITFGLMFPNLVHQITKAKVLSYNEVYDKYDKIFRLDLTQPKTNSLKIPVATSVFTLSKKDYKHGDIIYGEVTYAIHDYYKDDLTYKSGYIHIRESGLYFFKSVINKPML